MLVFRCFSTAVFQPANWHKTCINKLMKIKSLVSGSQLSKIRCTDVLGVGLLRHEEWEGL